MNQAAKVEVGRGAVMRNVKFGDIGNVIVKTGEPQSAADQPPAAAEPAAAPGWTPARIRELLTAAFADEELTTLCYDHFRPVYEDFSAVMSKGQKVQRLLDYCERHIRTDELLRRAQERNPRQFAKFQAGDHT
jgi:hypothetical protein